MRQRACVLWLLPVYPAHLNSQKPLNAGSPAFMVIYLQYVTCLYMWNVDASPIALRKDSWENNFPCEHSPHQMHQQLRQRMLLGQRCWRTVWETLAQFPAVPHVFCLPLGKCIHFSVPLLLLCKAEIIMHRQPVLFSQIKNPLEQAACSTACLCNILHNLILASIIEDTWRYLINNTNNILILLMLHTFTAFNLPLKQHSALSTSQ